MDSVDFLDLKCISLKNESLRLYLTQEVGPRVLALFIDGENLFAELPDLTIDNPVGSPYQLRGGHRLWYAPEIPEWTYEADDDPVHAMIDGRRITSAQTPDKGSGIQKTIELWLPSEEPIVVVDHILTNEGGRAVHCAPWAITQLKPGGTAILPLNKEISDSHGLQPNRSIALWPYTDVNASQLTWGNQYLFVEANMTEGALKIGTANPSGWIGYFKNRKLFVKFAAYHEDSAYFDFSASSQCYCSSRFIELETLGPKSLLEPGGSVTHREVWQVFSDFKLSMDEAELGRRLEAIDMASSRSYL